jgi:predicted outer membrane repeat protein
MPAAASDTSGGSTGTQVSTVAAESTETTTSQGAQEAGTAGSDAGTQGTETAGSNAGTQGTGTAGSDAGTQGTGTAGSNTGTQGTDELLNSEEVQESQKLLSEQDGSEETDGKETEKENEIETEKETEEDPENAEDPEADTEEDHSIVRSAEELKAWYGETTEDGIQITISEDQTVYVADTLIFTEDTWTLSGGGTLMRDPDFTDTMCSVESGVLILQDITLDGNREQVTANGPLVRLANSTGELEICDGAVLQNNENASESAGKAGGAICIYTLKTYSKETRGSSLHMSGGIIQKNSSARFGGAIYCNAQAEIEITGGTICENQVVSGNGTGYGGGAIYLSPVSSNNPMQFSMTGGVIAENEARYGSGILINANASESTFAFGGSVQIQDVCYLTGPYAILTMTDAVEQAISVELAANKIKEGQMVAQGTDTYTLPETEDPVRCTNITDDMGFYLRKSRDNYLYISEIPEDKYRGTICIMADGEDISTEVEFHLTDSQGNAISPLTYSEYVFALTPGETYTCKTGSAVGYQATTQQFTVETDDDIYTIQMQQGKSNTISYLSQLVNNYGVVDEEAKTITITVPEGTVVNLGGTMEFDEEGYTYILTGGGTLKRGTSNRNVMLDIESDTTVILEDMILDGNRKKIRSNRGIVNISAGGKFVMNGGVIQNNYLDIANYNMSAYMQGGTIHVSGNSNSDADFIMNGGTIRNNYSAYGGAVLLYGAGANLEINGGEITGNLAYEGGAIYLYFVSEPVIGADGVVPVYYRDTITMNGGSITSNQAEEDGGAIYCDYGFLLTLNQGELSGNTAIRYGDGIFDSSELAGDSITLGGGISLLDNVYLRILGYGSEYFLIKEALEYDIYLETTNASTTLYEGNVIAKGVGGYKITDADAQKIHVVNDGYEADADTLNNELQMKKKEYKITFVNASGRVLSEKIYKHDQKVTPPTATKTKDDTYVYVFSGWSDGTTTYTKVPKAKAETVYTAVFTAYTYDGYFIYLQSQITKVSYTQTIRDELKAIKQAYEALTDEQKAQPEVAKAYEKYLDQQAVFDLIYKVKSIGTVTIGSGNAVTSAQKAYEALTARGLEIFPDKYKVMLEEAVEAYRLLTRGQTITVPYGTYNVAYGTAPFSLDASTSGDSVLTYSSSNENVATVSSKGKVTVVGVGNAVITITAPETDNYDEAVKTVLIKARRGYQTITATIEHSSDTFVVKASTSGDGKLLYTSGDMTLATVNNTGVVTLKGLGTVKITVKAVSTQKYYEAQKEISFDITAQKGKTYTVGQVNYYVTNNATDGSGTVVVTGTSSSSLTSLNIANTVKLGNYTYKVTAINDSAFNGQTSLKTVKIGSSITKIGKSAFSGCTSLTSVTGGSGVTTIDNYAFYRCSSLSSFPVCNKVSYLGSSAFRNCTSLKSITVGSSVTTIGANAFYSCSSLKTITVSSTKLSSVGSKIFSGIAATAVIKVPSSKYTAYKKLLQNKGQASSVKITK